MGELTTAPTLISRVCVAYRSRAISAENGWHEQHAKQCEHDFQALEPLCLLSHGSCG